jgi:hypothetical protein
VRQSGIVLRRRSQEVPLRPDQCAPFLSSDLRPVLITPLGANSNPQV